MHTDGQPGHSCSPLAAILCGYEKSGTTLLNEILRRHPKLDSGFEVGALLADSPRQFRQIQPYFAFFRSTWKLTREDMQYICDTDEWGDFYRRSRERSPVIVDKRSLIFDKTPIYMRHLSQVLDRVPGIPCIVNVRDPRALMLSWARWSGHAAAPAAWIEENFASNLERFTSYAEGYRGALARHGDRILLNRFEAFCIDPAAGARRIFRFLGLQFAEEYLTFASEHFVYGNAVSTEYLTPYRDILPGELCERILAATSDYADWHYDPACG